MLGVRRVTVVGVVLALAGVGCTSEGPPEDPSSARGRVQQLVRALVEVDADGLRDLVSDDSLDLSAELLVDDVVAQGALARRDVTIDADTSNLGYVAYELDTDPSTAGPQPWLDVEVRSSGELIGSVLPTVEVSGRGITALRVGDVEVPVAPLPPEGRTYYLPPGVLTVAAVGPDGLVEHGDGERIDTRDRASLSLGGELTAAGEAQVRRVAAAFVRRCTRPVQGDRPVRCPARKAFVGGLESSAWTLDAPVRVSTEEGSTGWTVRTDDPPAARMTGQYLDRERGVLVPVTDRVRFRVEGTVEARGDRLVVEVRG